MSDQDAYIGYRSAGRRPESQQYRKASADAPLALLRGLASGVLGAPGDIESLIRMLPGLDSETFLPTSEEIEAKLPVRRVSETPVGRAATGLGQIAGGLYQGRGSPLKVIAEMPKSVRKAASDFVEAAGQPAVRALPPSRYVGRPLEGLPAMVDVGGRMEEFGTDQRIVDIAKQLAEEQGLVYRPQTAYAKVDEDRAKRLAQAYQEMANDPANPAVRRAYDKMIEETMQQYEALRRAGYKFDFMPESGDIYGNPRNAINDIVLNKRLSVFPTEQGFGGPSAAAASEANPLLMRTGETWGGKPVTANDLFRAVQDVFGHAKHGVGFRAAGEEKAVRSHARMYSPEALPAATSETRGQNSWVNYGPYGKFNRTADPAVTEYAEQKTGIMPRWTWLEGMD